jgi:hypothetical protein
MYRETHGFPLLQVFVRESVSAEDRQAAREAMRLRKAAALAAEPSVEAPMHAPTVGSPMHAASPLGRSARRTKASCKVASIVNRIPGMQSTVVVCFRFSVSSSSVYGRIVKWRDYSACAVAAEFSVASQCVGNLSACGKSLGKALGSTSHVCQSCSPQNYRRLSPRC